MATLVFDVECYSNFLLVLFKDILSGAVTRIQISPNRKLNRQLLLHVLNNNLLIGFNSHDYDVPLIQCALKGYSLTELKAASDSIVHGLGRKEFYEKHELNKPAWDHIDLIQVAPLKASLKCYAGRLHCRKLQDLPIDPDATLTAEQAAIIAEYCENDLDNTATLYRELEGQIQLRVDLSRTYQQDLRSRSDAQVAEHIISAEIKRILGMWPKRPAVSEGTQYRYNVPEYVTFKHRALRPLLDVIRASNFTVGPTGSIVLPDHLREKNININGATYRIGIGGLHSSESKVEYHSTDDTLLIDRDVTSYYPNLILNQGLYPKHLGEAFLTVYRSLVDRRIAAKKAGDTVTAESLKIAVNGSFGKLGNKYSALYSPDLLIQVTLTGQLCLLMLIERIEAAGIPVISANTDGIVIECPRPRYGDLCAVIGEWEKVTGLQTEETRYRALYSKDVNNYLAIKEDGKVKGKGLYANPWSVQGPNIFKLHKNPQTTVVIEAVIAYLRDGVPIEETIQGCEDVRKFISLRTVNGGAKQNEVYVGKVVRWYYAVDSRTVMNYRNSGYKVPKSDNSKPLMVLPDVLPDDLNYQWYVDEAKAVLRSIGYGQPRLY